MALAPHIPQPVRLGLALPIVIVGLPVLAGLGWLLAGNLGAALLPTGVLGLLFLIDFALLARRRRAALAALETLASAARRGVPLDRALFAAGADARPGGRGAVFAGRRARRCLGDLGTALLHGESLAAGLDRHLPLLPAGDRRAIGVAERRGNLPATLARLVDARRRSLMGPEFGAAGPPAMRLVVAHAAVLGVFLLAGWVFVAVRVAPLLIEIANDFEQPLPAFTRWIFPLGEVGGSTLQGVGGLVAVGVATLVLALCTVAVARVLPGAAGRRGPLGDALAWAWPPTRHAAWSAAFATLADSLHAGLDLPGALHDAADASGSRVARRRLRRTAEAHERDPDAGFRGFPPLARELLGGPAGVRPATAALLAEAYAEKAEASSAWLQAVCLPLVVIVAAVPVLLFCLALFLPLVSLIEQLTLEVWP